MRSSCCKVFRLLSGTLPRDIAIVSWMQWLGWPPNHPLQPMVSHPLWAGGEWLGWGGTGSKSSRCNMRTNTFYILQITADDR